MQRITQIIDQLIIETTHYDDNEARTLLDLITDPDVSIDETIVAFEFACQYLESLKTKS